MRSPNYPAIGLPDALAEARKIWDKEKKTAVSIDVLATAMGYSSVSGNVRTKVAALRKYGLLEQQGGKYRLSEIAMKALHGQPEEQEQALAIAAQRPELFKEMLTSHPDASDAALRSELVLRRSFSEAGAKQFIKAYRETLSIANPSKAGYSGGEEVEVPEAMTSSSPPAGVIRTGDGIKIAVPPISRPNPSTFVMPLSKDVTAQVIFSGGDVKAAHLDRLAKYLELAKGALEAEEEEESQ